MHPSGSSPLPRRQTPVPLARWRSTLFQLATSLVIALFAGCSQKDKTPASSNTQPVPGISRSVNAAITNQRTQAPPATPPQAPQNERLSCSTFPLDKHFGKRQLWDGYQIAIQPTDEDKFNDATDGDTVNVDPLCRLAILDPSGKQIYTDDLLNVTLDDATGLAIDGAPDIVVHHDYGGNHGAGGISVISLKPEPHVILDLDEEAWGQKQFEKDSKYGAVLSSDEWQDELQLAYDWPNARVPAAVRVYRFAGGTLEDITPEYCAGIQSNPRTLEIQRWLSQQALQDFKNAQDLSQEADAGSAAVSLIVQDIFCHQFQNAYDKVRNLWPERDRPNLIKNLQRASRNWECPECTKAVEQWH
jgi:hypothetical protein